MISDVKLHFSEIESCKHGILFFQIIPKHRDTELDPNCQL